MTADLLESDRASRRSATTWPGGGGRPVLLVLAVTIALVLSAGVTAVVRLSGGGPQPEDVLPASTFAFVKLDLDPAASQKLAVRALARRFPDAPGDDLREFRDAAARELVEPLGLDFDDDVAPWIGDRYAVAGFVDGDETHALAVVQVRDENSALRAIAKGDPDVGVVLGGGYALIARTQAVADAAARQAASGSLAELAGFAADLDRLSGAQIAVGWLDNEQLYDRAFGDVVTALEMDAAAHDPRSALSGRSVFGVHATAHYVELEAIVVDGPATPTVVTGTAELLESLPTDTVVAVLLANPAAAQPSTALVRAFGGYFGDGGLLGLGDAVGSRGGPDSLLPIAYALEPLEAELESQLLPLLRGATAIAIGPLPGGPSSRSDAAALLVADVAAPGNAVVPLNRARDALRREGLVSEVVVRGGRVHLAVGSAYIEHVGEPGALGRADLFRLAMGTLPSGLTSAMFVDLSSWPRGGGLPALDRPVRAIGMTARAAGTSTALRLRVVIG